jgi:hypothetical protein
VVAIGTATTAAGRRLPFAVVSANGGASWSQTPLPAPNGSAVAPAPSVDAAAPPADAPVPTADAAAPADVTGPTASATGSTASAAGLTTEATALTAAGGGFTATGTYGRAGARRVVVWLSADGAAWTVATPVGTGLAGRGTQAITALTCSGVTLTGVGFAGEEPTLWQSPVR